MSRACQAIAAQLRRQSVPVRTVALLPTGLRVFLADGVEYDLPLSPAERTEQHLRRDLQQIVRALVQHHRRQVVLVPKVAEAEQEDRDVTAAAKEASMWWDRRHGMTRKQAEERLAIDFEDPE